ncbi:MAG: type I-U CRISPR-associated protein Cas7 [Gordonia amarae]
MPTITSPADFDSYGAISAITEYVPAAGRGGPVSPATYAKPEGAANTFENRIARSHGVPVPVRDVTGEFDDFRRDDNGSPILSAAVIINGIASEAHRITDALLGLDDVEWGRIVIAPPGRDRSEAAVAEARADADKLTQADKKWGSSLFHGPDADTVALAIADAMEHAGSSSWEASHRHADALIRYADNPETGQQLWSGTSDLKRTLISADPLRDATWLLRNAFSSLLLGFWNANSGAGVRAKLARSLTAEVMGYGAHLVVTGTTKGSDIGDMSKNLAMCLGDDGQLMMLPQSLSPAQQKSLPPTQKKWQGKPSEFGIGTVPGPLGASAVSCETILRRSTLSLARLRNLRFGDGPDAAAKRTAAVRALSAAGMYATAVVASEVCDLRSGTTLAPVSTAWPTYTTRGEKVLLDVDTDTARSVLLAAMDDLDRLGLGQADPITLTHSGAVLQARASSAAERKDDDNSSGTAKASSAGESS